MKTYNFSRCEHAQVINNKYTGELISIPCGTCKGCLLDRRDRLTLLVKAEEQKHKYTLFTTLTYNNEYIPILQPIRNKRATCYRFFNLTHRLHTIGSLVFKEYDTFHKSKEWIKPLLRKFNLGGFVPFCNKRDIQLFLKRLRKLLSRYTDEHIKYYAVSEYGPHTFRPHYHLLFFYSNTQTNHYIQRCIRMAWCYYQKQIKYVTTKTPVRKTTKIKKKVIYKARPMGRIDCSLTKGHADSYVAGYLNCSCSLPRFFAFAKFARPFVLHSKGFAQPFSEDEKKEIYENAPACFSERSYQSNGKIYTYELQRYFKARYFPRCNGFNTKSQSELYITYSLYRTAQQEFNQTSVSVLATNIYMLLQQSIIDTPTTKYFSKLCKQSDYQHFSSDIHYFNNDKLMIQRIQSELYLSKHFHDFVCDGRVELYHYRIKQIVDFWNFEEYRKLCKFYETQSEFIRDYPTLKHEVFYLYLNFLPYFHKYYKPHLPYDNVISESFYDFVDYVLTSNVDINNLSYYNTSMYSNIQYDNSIKFDDSIKHKKLNDLNNIFKDL